MTTPRSTLPPRGRPVGTEGVRRVAALPLSPLWWSRWPATPADAARRPAAGSAGVPVAGQGGRARAAT